MMNTHLTTTRRLPVAFVVPDWSGLDGELAELLVHGGILCDAGRSGSTTTLDYLSMELGRAHAALSGAARRWETRNRSGLMADGRARATAMAHAYEAAITAAGYLADTAADALDRELSLVEVRDLRAVVARALAAIEQLA